MGEADKAGTAREVPCDVRGFGADAATLDVLARLALAARRRGRQLTLRNASPELRDLTALAGLSGVLPVCGRSAVRVVGQAEQREQVRVEEDRDPADPPG